MVKMARPVTYKEPRRAITIYIDKQLSDKIDETARKNGISRIEYINALIVHGDEERAILLAKSYEALKKAVSSLSEMNREHGLKFEECVKKLKKYIGGGVAESIYCAIEPDDIAKEAFNRKRRNFTAVKDQNPDMTPEQIEVWVGKLYVEMEKVAFEQGKVIKIKTLAKEMLKKLLLDDLNQINSEKEKYRK